MPKLKSALLAHQSNAARYAAELKAAERREAIYGGGSGKKKKSKVSLQQAALPTKLVASKAGSVVYRKGGVLPPGKGKDSHTSETDTKGKGKAAPHSQKQRKPTIPFDKLDTILLLGEANFSFARSLLLPPHSLSGHMILATSYDSEQTCYAKYEDAKDIVKELRDKGVKVGFEVDAGDLGRGKVGKLVGKGKRWSRVIFNFPHVGAGIKDQDRNILSNQHLLLRTLQSVYPILTSGPPSSTLHVHGSSKKRKRSASENDDEEDGDEDRDFDEDADNSDDNMDGFDSPSSPPTPSTFLPPNRQGTILFTLLDQNPYTLWNLPKLATKPPPITPGPGRLPQPKYTLLRSFEFRPEVYEGYAHRRTLGFKVGKSRDGNEEITGRKGMARTWEFAAKEEVDED